MTKVMKGLVSSAAVASLLLFTGCGDKKAEDGAKAEARSSNMFLNSHTL